MTTGERIRNKRESLGITQDELAYRMGYKSRTSITHIEQGGDDVTLKTVHRVAAALNCDYHILLGWVKDDSETIQETASQIVKEAANLVANRPGVSRIPVLGRVAAGSPITATEEIIDYEDISEERAKTGEYFGLRIKGDSMTPRINDGDTVIVHQQDCAEDGEIVIALINGDDAVCKKLKIYGDSIALVSLNPAYDPLIFSAEEQANKPVRIIGRVVELRARL